MWPSSWPHGPPQPSPLQPHQLASSPMQLASLSKSTVAFVVPYQLGPPPTQLLLYTLPSYPPSFPGQDQLALPRFQIQLTPSPTSTPFHHPIILLYCLSLPLLTLINKRSYMQHVEDIVHLSVSRPILQSCGSFFDSSKRSPIAVPSGCLAAPEACYGVFFAFFTHTACLWVRVGWDVNVAWHFCVMKLMLYITDGVGWGPLFTNRAKSSQMSFTPTRPPITYVNTRLVDDCFRFHAATLH